MGQLGDWRERRIRAALPEAMDYLPDHPDRQERVARAMLERIFAATDILLPFKPYYCEYCGGPSDMPQVCAKCGEGG